LICYFNFGNISIAQTVEPFSSFTDLFDIPFFEKMSSSMSTTTIQSLSKNTAPSVPTSPTFTFPHVSPELSRDDISAMFAAEKAKRSASAKKGAANRAANKAAGITKPKDMRLPLEKRIDKLLLEASRGVRCPSDASPTTGANTAHDSDHYLNRGFFR
jgi:hypothetical protein